MKIGMMRDGRVTACQAEVVQRGGAYGGYGLVTILYAGAMINGIYDIPAVKYDGYRVYANTPACGAMRGHGTVNTRFAFESLMDSMADELGLDPFAVRRRNLLVAPPTPSTGSRLPLMVCPSAWIGWSAPATGRRAKATCPRARAWAWPVRISFLVRPSRCTGRVSRTLSSSSNWISTRQSPS